MHFQYQASCILVVKPKFISCFMRAFLPAMHFATTPNFLHDKHESQLCPCLNHRAYPKAFHLLCWDLLLMILFYFLSCFWFLPLILYLEGFRWVKTAIPCVRCLAEGSSRPGSRQTCTSSSSSKERTEKSHEKYGNGFVTATTKPFAPCLNPSVLWLRKTA